MAIQVSGSTVIHDSQDVQVSGMFTASSFVGDASQLTNLPASGGTLEATASGTLSDGSTVIVNADGTVSVVAETETTGPGAGTPEVFESATTRDITATFDSSNNRVVVAYRDGGNSNYGTAVVGTVNPSTNAITFGTPVVFNSAAAYDISATFDSTNNKVVIAYYDNGNSNYGTAIVGTVDPSNNSISFGSKSVFRSAASYWIVATYDSTNNRVAIAFRDQGNSGAGTAVIGEVSGTSISFGSHNAFESNETESISATFDSTNGKVVIAYNDAINHRGEAVVGTVNAGNNTIAYGSIATFESSYDAGYVSATFDSTNGKVVIAYRDNGNSYYGTAVVGEVSGTSISFGSEVVFKSANTSEISAVYDSSNGKVVISYKDGVNSDYGTAIVGTVSGTSISFGSPVVFESATTYDISATFDSANGRTVIAYRDNGNSNYGTAAVFSQTGYGSVPQMGSATVFESADSQYSSATYDPSNNKVVIAYTDYGNNYRGTAIVGTVSGTSISFGSPVVFNSSAAGSYHISSVYDPDTQKIVIAYRNAGDGGNGTAIVGTVSGTSISFGTSAVFNSSGNTTYTSATYDSSNQKVVIVYTDAGNSYYGGAVVGTVSGTSISFGSEVIFNSSTTYYSSVEYDPSNNKVVIVYRNGGNSWYGTAIIGTVSGNSISFGTPTAFNSNGTSYPFVKYDPNNQKVVIAYRDNGNSDYGTAIVGTVSGTSISFGSATVFASSANLDPSVVYDSANQKVIIAYRDLGNSDYGTVVVGTVSGTSISFDSPIVFESAATYLPSATYDSSNDRVVIAYTDNGNSGYGTAIVFTPFTISRNLTSENYIGISNGSYSDGQTATIQVTGSVDDAQSGLTAGQSYYVQNDGTLSTSADSPSVFAGTAVSASKIIVKG